MHAVGPCPVLTPREPCYPVVPAIHLTARELDVLRLVACGLADKQVARELGIRTHTAKNHLRAIRQKLAVPDRTSAVVVAMKAGWI